jgi:hypothetical protein
MKTLVALILIVSPLGEAQIKAELFSGVNFPSASIPFGTTHEYVALHEYWRPASNIGIALQFSMLPWIEVGSVLEYNRYSFKGYFEEMPIESPRVKSSSGEVSQILRASIETTLLGQPDSLFCPYFVTGLAHIVEEIGRIRVNWTQQNGPEYTTQINFDKREYWAHSLGIGFRMSFWRSVGIDVSAKYFSNYNDRLDASLNIGVVIVLQE